jgi:hypothetical protein
MTILGNLSLNLANRAAADAARKWAEHRQCCSTCQRAMRCGATDSLCDQGTRLLQDRRACCAELAAERKLAAEPDPNQGRLF